MCGGGPPCQKIINIIRDDQDIPLPRNLHNPSPGFQVPGCARGVGVCRHAVQDVFVYPLLRRVPAGGGDWAETSGKVDCGLWWGCRVGLERGEEEVREGLGPGSGGRGVGEGGEDVCESGVCGRVSDGGGGWERGIGVGGTYR